MCLFLVFMYKVFHRFFYVFIDDHLNESPEYMAFAWWFVNMKGVSICKKKWNDFIGMSFIKAEIELFSRSSKGHKRCNYCNPSWYRMNLHWLVWTFRWTPWTFSLQLCEWYYPFVDCTAERMSFSPALSKLNAMSVIERNFLNFRCTNWL